MSLRFFSDHATTASGWMAIVESIMISVNEINPTQKEFSVYPNPASSVIHIRSELLNCKLQIYSMNGQIMASDHLPPGSQHTQTDISAFPAGIYLLVLSNGSQQAQKKILKY
jgi:hypothetical protein